MEKANYLCDLHTHTSRSDGADTPQELITKAAGLGVEVLAITDHDRIPEDLFEDEYGKERKLTDFAKSLKLTLLLGMEVSCDTNVEDVHIICFGCDWKNGWFKKMENEVAVSREEGYKKLVERLREDEIDITWEEVLGSSVKSGDKRHVQKKRIYELMAKKGAAKDWSEAKLLVLHTKRYQIKRKKPDPIEVIKAVHYAGGVTILAHPFLINESVYQDGMNVTREEYIERLINAGLDGIEACYAYDKTSYEGTLGNKEMEAYIRETYGNRVKILSGGSDYHGEQKKAVGNPRRIGECGVSAAYFYTISKYFHIFS